mmetsp:Transcript_9911/g.41596  ORF Transcript_9911/g.41596 Transcript_9911/m.41596 type:complete len:287 (-) Transcript_9911:224-1084(-)
MTTASYAPGSLSAGSPAMDATVRISIVAEHPSGVSPEDARSRAASHSDARYRVVSSTRPSGMCSAEVTGAFFSLQRFAEAAFLSARVKGRARSDASSSSSSSSSERRDGRFFVASSTSGGTSIPGISLLSSSAETVTPLPPASNDAGACFARSRACFSDRAGRHTPARRAMARPRFSRGETVGRVFFFSSPFTSSRSAVASIAVASIARSAFSAASTSSSVAATPSVPRHIIFPRGVYGCNKPAATPEAPPATRFSSMSVTRTGATILSFPSAVASACASATWRNT